MFSPFASIFNGALIALWILAGTDEGAELHRGGGEEGGIVRDKFFSGSTFGIGYV